MLSKMAAERQCWILAYALEGEFVAEVAPRRALTSRLVALSVNRKVEHLRVAGPDGKVVAFPSGTELCCARKDAGEEG